LGGASCALHSRKPASAGFFVARLARAFLFPSHMRHAHIELATAVISLIAAVIELIVKFL
jgi:hypothetical protein